MSTGVQVQPARLNPNNYRSMQACTQYVARVGRSLTCRARCVRGVVYIRIYVALVVRLEQAEQARACVRRACVVPCVCNMYVEGVSSVFARCCLGKAGK